MALYKDGDYPGAYSTRASHKAIAADLLKKIQFNGGKLSYEYLINPAHRPDTQEMMRNIIDKMIKEDLIAISGQTFLVISEKGKLALEAARSEEKKEKDTSPFLKKALKYLIILLFAIAAVYILLQVFLHLNKYESPGGDESPGTQVSP
jgi:hypothetical protein